MDGFIGSLGKETVFYMLDTYPGYKKVDINERDRDKTACTYHRGLCRLTKMPYGLKHAPATLQKAIYVIVASVQWLFAFFWLNYIVVICKILAGYIGRGRRILRLHHKRGVPPKLKNINSSLRPSNT